MLKRTERTRTTLEFALLTAFIMMAVFLDNPVADAFTPATSFTRRCSPVRADGRIVAVSRISKTEVFSEQETQEDKLSKLGYSSEEIATATKKKAGMEEPPQSVNVNLIDDIDPVTITALGFAAIAFNFLVFANMGDAGLAGGVARIINFFRN
mmetsp:Transcript_22219/g.33352  ORF Transcript_22219/g.33352 Transcript_22219/m.33352 type:complete len:153 (-) Transcript_22219:280-738(-)|eukprot:CAMPEP_0116019286 /NCGR_PEP_ID=MMETSP0321-20121206/9146_1 /TAXON_ID=163516 /ORGANISM="Leptocylindrus danicus var. danicus, Strain B650" /LENGTH=152 /DNA_ID=CAMNT_0003489827 /DNA_START=119 /DNA_END=577 /DNA_ORIENTATION=+